MTGGPQPFGSLREHLAAANPHGNVLRSIDLVNAGGDATQRPEMRDAFVETERLEAEARGAAYAPGVRVDFTRSAGPVAARYVLSSDPVAIIAGPRGSAKTTETFKKVLFEGQSIRPGADGGRRYVVSVWREKYINIWDATIGSWWKLFPADLAGSNWNGSKPHPATHVLRFDDDFGPIEIIVRFRAFGDSADSDDTLGNEGTDVLLNQIDTMPERLFTWLGAVIGRDPPRGLLYPDMPDDFVYGKIYGDMNAPTPISWLYRDFYEKKKPGYVLYNQPGGLEPDAENIHVVGRGYYHNLLKLHPKWWTNINVHNRPGFRMEADTPFANEDGPLWDDRAMMSPVPLIPDPNLPVLVGEDGGLTPAAAYLQEMPDGQLRIYAEVALQRGGMKELAEHMLAIEASRFRDCDFEDAADPAMRAGEDTADGSDRKKLSKYLGREVHLAPAGYNNLDTRHQAYKDKMVIKAGKPMLLLDPSCVVTRRGLNGSYRFHEIKNQGARDRGSIAKDFTTHVIDAGLGAAMLCGNAVARKRKTDRDQERAEARAQARQSGRYNPLNRRAAR